MIAATQRKKTGLGAIIFLALAGLLLLGPNAAEAQVLPDIAPKAPADTTTEDMKTLLDTLEDPAAREKLAAQLRAMIAAQEEEKPGAGERLMTALSDGVESATEQIGGASEALTNVPAVVNWINVQIADPAVRDAIFAAILKLIVVFGAAAIVSFGVSRLLAYEPRAITVESE